MIIHKSHSKNDLIELIIVLELKIVYSHADNKKDIHKIKNYNDLKNYLKQQNPKKILSVKEKNDIMTICKHIIHYCKQGYIMNNSLYYNEIKQIEDDMDYIKQFGDIPSVRRCCKLMNKQRKVQDYYQPIISPQVQKLLNDKLITKNKGCNCLKVYNGTYTLEFK